MIMYRLAVLGFLGSSVLGMAQFPNSCENQTPLPFAAIEKHHPIDDRCGVNGKPTSPAASRTQNAVKNNFCAVASNNTPETFTPQKLIDLQRDNQFQSGRGLEPADRTALKNAGEGKLIRMKAYLIEAHHADLGGGESVNCNGPNEEDNDIHIALGSEPGTEECSSVSAEISPHFRPASWNEIGHFETWDASNKQYIPNPAIASRLQAHPYRITGQLFFDASHAPCPCGTACSPVRSSVWEIHPVYAIEVCKSGASCDENNDADWIAFDKWWGSLVPARKTRGRHSHRPHEPGTTGARKTQKKKAG